MYIASYLRDARAAIPNKSKATAEAFRCFEKVRVKHCTAIQVRWPDTDTSGSTALSPSRTLTHPTNPPRVLHRPCQTESEGYAKNAYGSQRKLGGYRLVKFQLVPFADVYAGAGEPLGV